MEQNVRVTLITINVVSCSLCHFVTMNRLCSSGISFLIDISSVLGNFSNLSFVMNTELTQPCIQKELRSASIKFENNFCM